MLRNAMRFGGHQISRKKSYKVISVTEGERLVIKFPEIVFYVTLVSIVVSGSKQDAPNQTERGCGQGDDPWEETSLPPLRTRR